MPREKRDQGTNRLMEVFFRMVLGGALGFAVCLVLLGIGALAMVKGILPATLLTRICIAGCCLGGFTGGLLALRGGQGKTLLVGLGTSAIFFLFLLVAGVVFYRDISPLSTGGRLLFSALIGGSLAGFAAARPKRRKYPR